MGEKSLLIICVIIVVAISKIIYQLYKKNVGERGTYHRVSRPSSNSILSSNSVSSYNSISPLNSISSSNSISASSSTSQQPLNMNEFGPVNYYANARHNQKDTWFKFMYRKVNGEWLTYILRMPSLNGRSGDLHLTHRYKNSENSYWICYDPQPRTLKDAQNVSRAWGDRELEYIATGVPFEQQSW